MLDCFLQNHWFESFNSFGQETPGISFFSIKPFCNGIWERLSLFVDNPSLLTDVLAKWSLGCGYEKRQKYNGFWFIWQNHLF